MRWFWCVFFSNRFCVSYRMFVCMPFMLFSELFCTLGRVCVCFEWKLLYARVSFVISTYFSSSSSYKFSGSHDDIRNGESRTLHKSNRQNYFRLILFLRITNSSLVVRRTCVFVLELANEAMVRELENGSLCKHKTNVWLAKARNQTKKNKISKRLNCRSRLCPPTATKRRRKNRTNIQRHKNNNRLRHTKIERQSFVDRDTFRMVLKLHLISMEFRFLSHFLCHHRDNDRNGVSCVLHIFMITAKKEEKNVRETHKSIRFGSLTLLVFYQREQNKDQRNIDRRSFFIRNKIASNAHTYDGNGNNWIYHIDKHLLSIFRIFPYFCDESPFCVVTSIVSFHFYDCRVLPDIRNKLKKSTQTKRSSVSLSSQCFCCYPFRMIDDSMFKTMPSNRQCRQLHLVLYRKCQRQSQNKPRQQQKQTPKCEQK